MDSKWTGALGDEDLRGCEQASSSTGTTVLTKSAPDYEELRLQYPKPGDLVKWAACAAVEPHSEAGGEKCEAVASGWRKGLHDWPSIPRGSFARVDKVDADPHSCALVSMHPQRVLVLKEDENH